MKKSKNIKTKSAKTRTKVNIKRYFQVLGISLLVVLGIGIVAMGFNFNKVTTTDGLEPVDLKQGKINVLLLGVDVEGLRTDAIMVASYDIQAGKINLLSIPRDTRMWVGSKYQKINAAHAIGGMTGKIAGPEGTIEAVNRLTAIPIHYYIEFSFTAIDNFIDALGGVDFDVPDVEKNGRGMNYDDPVQNLHIHLKPGQQHLTGNQVQQLLRYRKSNTPNVGYADGDRGRVEMQQNFIKELVNQKLNASLILKIPDLFDQLKKDIKTNLSLADLTKYAGYLKDFKSENIATYQLPGEGNSSDYGASYWICNLEETKTLIQDVFGYDSSKITIDSGDGKSNSKNTKTTKSTSTAKPTKKPTPAKTTAPVEDDKNTEKPTSTKAPTTDNTTPKATITPTPKAEDSATTKSTPVPTESPKVVTTSKPTTSPVKTTAPVKTAVPEQSTIETANSVDNG